MRRRSARKRTPDADSIERTRLTKSSLKPLPRRISNPRGAVSEGQACNVVNNVLPQGGQDGSNGYGSTRAFMLC
jgi:hypothetical protein